MIQTSCPCVDVLSKVLHSSSPTVNKFRRFSFTWFVVAMPLLCSMMVDDDDTRDVVPARMAIVADVEEVDMI